MKRTPVINEWETRYSSPSGYPFQVRTKKMRVHDRIHESVIYLDSSVTDYKGSGFLVSYPSGLIDQNFVYAVTNRHIAIDDECDIITLTNVDGEKERLKVNPILWIHTTEDDLAIIPLSLDVDLHRFVTIPIASFVTEVTITDYDFGVGDRVYIVGRFHVHEGVSRILPTTRFGNIAMMLEEPIKISTSKRKDGKQDCFLVEMRSIGGFSGSPAILELSPLFLERPNWEALRKSFRERGITPATGPWLLGVDVGHLTQMSYLKKGKRGKEILGRMETNSAMTGIIPAWKLLNLLNNPNEVEKRREAVKKLREDRDNPSEEGWVADMLEKSDLSPTLRETIRRKIESGEDEGVDPDAFSTLLGRMTPPEQSDPED